MKISRENYEAYMIDYLDGKLDAVAVSELLLFLEQHKDLKKEFDLLGTITVKEAGTEVLDKSYLKKPVYDEVRGEFETKLIARFEGDLSVKEKYELEKLFPVYPELETEAALFEKTKLISDPAIFYPYKSELKKRVPVLQVNFSYVWRAAAVVAVFALAGLLMRITQQNESKVNEVAINLQEKAKVSKENKHLFSSATDNKVAAHKNLVEHKTGFSGKVKIHPALKAQVPFESIDTKGAQAIVLNNTLQLSTNIKMQKVNMLNSVAVQNNNTDQQDFKNVKQLAEERLQASIKDVLVEQNKPTSLHSHFSFSDIGLLALKFYNKTTGDDAKVVKKYDNSGKITGYSIVADNFTFSTGK